MPLEGVGLERHTVASHHSESQRDDLMFESHRDSYVGLRNDSEQQIEEIEIGNLKNPLKPQSSSLLVVVLEFKVTGLSCVNCSNAVENTVRRAFS